MTTNNETIFAIAGPVDAAKSTLIGVLTCGELDNGNGLARNKILVHPHEKESGRTSHITYNSVIYKYEDGFISLHNIHNENIKKIEYSYKKEDKIVSFLDLAGHEKYMGTTLFGITGLFPDYGIVVIAANTGITKLTREHLGILLYLKIPIIITITKIDLAPKQIYMDLCTQLKQLLSRNLSTKLKPHDALYKSLYFINATSKDISNDETNHYIMKMLGNPDIIPIISLSNKDGRNIDNLHKILYTLPKREKWTNCKINGTIYYIDSSFNVSGIGLVVSGTCRGEPIKIKQKLYLGPFNGTFKEVIVRSIHNSIRENITETNIGTQCCLAIKSTNQKDEINKNNIMKGMILLDSVDKYIHNITRTFWARINVLHHSSTIRTGYCPTIHCGPIRQAARLETDNNNILRTGDNCIVKFTFVSHAEFIEETMTFFFRDGTTKGLGHILKLS
jgi:GTPase